MTEVFRLGIQHTQAVKDTHKDIIFVQYDGYTPEKHELLTAQAIGEVCSNVLDISNYPSLSCCIKAGGNVTGWSNGSIHITFLNQESDPHFSEAFPSSLMSYSKKLCLLGFDNNYRTTPLNDIEKHEASEESKILISQADDITTQVGILSFVELLMVEFAKDWMQGISHVHKQTFITCHALWPRGFDIYLPIYGKYDIAFLNVELICNPIKFD